MNQIAMADVPTTGGELPAYRLRRVAQYIQENLRRELRLAELSAVVHMSPYHFARLFKRSTGLPPHRFLVRHRVEEARALLAARKVPIAEIARAVGFRTPSHFTMTFRRVTGMTPSAYRSGAQMAPPDRSARPIALRSAAPSPPRARSTNAWDVRLNADVPPGHFDDPGAVVVPRSLMSGDQTARQRDPDVGAVDFTPAVETAVRL